MADESIFGLPMEPSPSSDEVEEEITSESPAAEETVVEGSPEEDAGQPRDEFGRFASPTAPETDPEPEQALEAEAPADGLQSDLEPVADGGEAGPDANAAAEAEARLWANKFQSPEDLERGYNESREMWRRANEARKAEAQERMLLQERYAALYRQLEQATPVLQLAAEREKAFQAFAENYRQQTGEYPEGYTPPAPQSAPGPVDVEQIVDQRLAQERAAWEAQMAQRQEYQQLETAVMGFFQDHPEIEPGGALDTEITDAMEVLNESWDRYGIEVDPSDRGSLEIVYEASKDAALLEVLRLNPQYFESEYGMELARRDAAVISGKVPAITEPQTTRVPASQVKTSGAKKPFAESAAVGASSPNTEDESDPWVRIKNAPTPGGSDSSLFFE